MRKDLRNIIKNFIGGNILSILYILIGIITARVLGPEGKGSLVSALYWPQMLGWIFNFGLGYSNTLFISKDRKKLREVFSNSLFLSFFAGIIAIIIGYLLVPFLIKENNIKYIVKIGLLSIPFSILGDYLIWILNGMENYALFNLIRIAHPAFYLVLLLIFLKNLNVINAFIFSLFSSIVITLILCIFFLKKLHFKLSINLKLLFESLKYGLQSHLTHFAILGNKRADQGILIALVSPSLIAFYSMAVNISEMLLQISNAISLTIIPSISTLEEGEAFKKIKKRIKYSAIFLFLGGLILFFSAKYIINILYGDKFLPSLLPLRILLPATIFLGISEIIEAGLRGRGKPLYPSISQIITFFTNVILLIFLVPKLNIIGAAIASNISYFLLFIIDFIFILTFYKK
uniref:Uncharacterized protein n=1 Tax=candidate division WOR-3 bacterium TaxID=2052148 RepID=A0A7C4UFW8_UNCW3